MLPSAFAFVKKRERDKDCRRLRGQANQRSPLKVGEELDGLRAELKRDRVLGPGMMLLLYRNIHQMIDTMFDWINQVGCRYSCFPVGECKYHSGVVDMMTSSDKNEYKGYSSSKLS